MQILKKCTAQVLIGSMLWTNLAAAGGPGQHEDVGFVGRASSSPGDTSGSARGSHGSSLSSSPDSRSARSGSGSSHGSPTRTSLGDSSGDEKDHKKDSATTSPVSSGGSSPNKGSPRKPQPFEWGFPSSTTSSDKPEYWTSVSELKKAVSGSRRAQASAKQWADGNAPSVTEIIRRMDSFLRGDFSEMRSSDSSGSGEDRPLVLSVDGTGAISIPGATYGSLTAPVPSPGSAAFSPHGSLKETGIAMMSMSPPSDGRIQSGGLVQVRADRPLRVEMYEGSDEGSSGSSSTETFSLPPELTSDEGLRAARALLLNEYRYGFEDQNSWTQWIAIAACLPVVGFAAYSYAPVITDATADIFHHRLGLGKYTNDWRVLDSTIVLAISFAAAKIGVQLPQAVKYWTASLPDWKILPKFLNRNSLHDFTMERNFYIDWGTKVIKLSDAVLHGIWNVYFLIAIEEMMETENGINIWDKEHLPQMLYFIFGMFAAESVGEHEQASLAVNEGRSLTARVLKHYFGYELPKQIIPRVSAPYEKFRKGVLSDIDRLMIAVSVMPGEQVHDIYSKMFGKGSIYSKEFFMREYPDHAANDYRMLSGAARISYFSALASRITEEEEPNDAVYNNGAKAATGLIDAWGVPSAAIFLQFAYQATLSFVGVPFAGAVAGSIILTTLTMPFLTASSYVSGLEVFYDRVGKFMPSFLYTAEPDEHRTWMPLRAISMCVLAIPGTLLFTLPFLQGGLDSTDRFGEDHLMIAVRGIIISGFTANMGLGQLGEMTRAFVDYWPTLVIKGLNGIWTRIGGQRFNERDELIRSLKYHRNLAKRLNANGLALLRHLMGEDKLIEGE